MQRGPGGRDRPRRAPRFALPARSGAAALVVGLAIGIGASVAGDAAAADPCRVDRDCSGYDRCRDGVCAIPPAVSGRADARTPTVELIAEAGPRALFFVELATHRFEQMRGLGHRPSMAPGWGMLFVFARSLPRTFTMDPMRFALDMVFLDDAGKVVDIIENAQPRQPVPAASSAFRYALELNAGAVRTHGIRIGDRMELNGVSRQHLPAGG